MHPKEDRRQKTGTGRLTHFHFPDSELIVGESLADNPRVNQLIADPSYRAYLLYPADRAIELPAPDQAGPGIADLGTKRLLIFLLDATWDCAKKMYLLSPNLRALPTIKLRPRHPSRWLFKRQPGPLCLSTLEATHELLLGLEEAGLESYPDKTQLLRLFQAMQDFQVGAAATRPKRPGRPS